MTFRDAFGETMKFVLGALIGVFFAATTGAYRTQEFVILVVGFVAAIMGATAVIHAQSISRAAETALDELGDELRSVTHALGRPAEFYPRQLSEDDGHYFSEIARHIARTAPGDTIWIVTSHRSASQRSSRTQAVVDARKTYHEAIEDRADHGIHVRRILCFEENVSADALDARFFSRHTTDHCKRLWEIAKRRPDSFSIRMSRYYTGADFLVIPGRVAAVTADARDKDANLKHVLCWMFFTPPNGTVIATLQEWCEGLDNDGDVVRELPDGLVEGTLAPIS